MKKSGVSSIFGQIKLTNYIDVQIHPEEIDSLYLGCRMSSEDREQIKKTAKTVLPHVKIFQSSVHKSLFQLNFVEVS